MSFMYMRNNMEPKMDSWGTPLVIDPNKGLGDKNGMFWPISPFNFTNCLMISVFLAGKNTATEFGTDFSLLKTGPWWPWTSTRHTTHFLAQKYQI